jgi:AAA+ ATPase superfamily predicted ATPase
MAAGV